ncbi:hypothetical protein [Bacillus piscicola]|uniref:hypothetical protein n=1 Tax=Bacillus piscicola TaxID=1632684 RepID=UPI001F099AC1|nr:hypothetical protein [Bacillus piscicola]
MERMNGLSSLFSKDVRSHPLRLQPGQVFTGRVLKLFPHHMAALRLGTTTLTAHLEAALTAEQSYLFQVKEHEGIPKLRVLSQQEGLHTHLWVDSAVKTLHSLGLPDNRTNRTLLSLFQQEQLPFTKEMLQEGSRLLKQLNRLNTKGAQTLSFLEQKQLPLNRFMFESAYQALYGEKTLAFHMKQLSALLSQSDTAVSGSENRLRRVLERTWSSMRIDHLQQSASPQVAHFSKGVLTDQEKTALTDVLEQAFPNPKISAGQSYIAEKVLALIKQLGLESHQPSSAREVDNFHHLESLRKTLIDCVTELEGPVRKQAETLLQKLVGQQLLSHGSSDTVQQTVLQLPLTILNYETDLHIHWEGKKKQDGSLDPDYCRILFYLEMEFLGETIADVHIQNRFVTVHIFNDQPKPDRLFELLRPLLEERLTALDYKLSSVNWRQVKENKKTKQSANHPQSGRGGVDIRI